MKQTSVIIGTIIGVYLFCYVLEYGWKLFVRGPVALDSARQKQVDAAETRAQSLLRENEELRKPRKTSGQQAILDQAGSELANFDSSERQLLSLLIEREEMRTEDLKQQMKRSGFSEAQWSSVFQKARNGILVESIPHSPIRQYNALRINPVYRDALLELLHSDR